MNVGGKTMKTKVVAVFSALLLLSGSLATPAMAKSCHHRSYRGHANYHDGYYRARSYQHWSHQEYAKKGLIGAGTGAVIGGVLASEGNRAGAAVKGGLIGAGAGLAYEYLRRR
jgi:hypothetical protein